MLKPQHTSPYICGDMHIDPLHHIQIYPSNFYTNEEERRTSCVEQLFHQRREPIKAEYPTTCERARGLPPLTGKVAAPLAVTTKTTPFVKKNTEKTHTKMASLLPTGNGIDAVSPAISCRVELSDNGGPLSHFLLARRQHITTEALKKEVSYVCVPYVLVCLFSALERSSLPFKVAVACGEVPFHVGGLFVFYLTCISIGGAEPLLRGGEARHVWKRGNRIVSLRYRIKRECSHRSSFMIHTDYTLHLYIYNNKFVYCCHIISSSIILILYFHFHHRFITGSGYRRASVRSRTLSMTGRWLAVPLETNRQEVRPFGRQNMSRDYFDSPREHELRNEKRKIRLTLHWTKCLSNKETETNVCLLFQPHHRLCVDSNGARPVDKGIYTTRRSSMAQPQGKEGKAELTKEKNEQKNNNSN
eukprot:gene1657-1025_t